MCVQENNFKVKQIQYKGKGEVCHLGVISFEEKIKYVYIYDLGLKKKSFKEFYDKYLKDITKIDRIYLSHFCDDHIRGLNAIKQYDTGEKFKDVEYWLPYINEIDKYLPFLFIEEWSEKEYIEFKRIKDEFNISTSQLLDIFAKYQGKSLKETRMTFEDGSFLLDNLDEVLEFLNNLNNFNFFKEYTSFSFIKAFLKISSLKEYDHETMKKRLEKHTYKLEKRASYKDYIEMLVDIYNYGITKVRFGYDVRQDRFYFI